MHAKGWEARAMLTKSSFPCLMQNWSESNEWEQQITATAVTRAEIWWWQRQHHWQWQRSQQHHHQQQQCMNAWMWRVKWKSDCEMRWKGTGEREIQATPFTSSSSSYSFHTVEILILFLSASFVAGYERKLNNFQSNGYCNTQQLVL